MARTYTFVSAEHEDYGTIGWKPKWMPDADPLTGIAVAHDILEHVGKQHGTVEDEMRAFGAMLFVRAEAGYWSMKGSFHPNWSYQGSGEIVEMIRKHLDYYKDWVEPRNLKSRSVRLDDWIEDEIKQALVELAKHIRDEFSSPDDRELRDQMRTLIGGLYRERLIQLWREGYRQAARKYRGRYEEVCHLFMAIEKEVGKHEPEYPGMELKVRVDLKRFHAEVELVEDYE